MKMTRIEFYDAKILSERGKDICVYLPATGDFFNFNNMWKTRTSPTDLDDLIQEIGVAGISKTYVFFWCQCQDFYN